MMLYIATLDRAWAEDPTHERISDKSGRVLQCTREDWARLSELPIDEDVPIVCVVIDCTTDKGHFHFCKRAERPEGELKKEIRQLAEDDEEVVYPLRHHDSYHSATDSYHSSR